MAEKKKDPEQFRMTFTGHLVELRRRLAVCAVALLVGMAISYAFRDYLFSFILHPLFEARGAESGAPPDRPAVEDGARPTKAADLARDARRLSKLALAAEDPGETARLAARAAAKAAEAVEQVEASEVQRAEQDRRRQQRSIAYTNPIKPFWVSLQLALVGGICLSFGVILWEIWAFIAPGLYPTEKRYAAPFVVSASGCFLAGAYFGYRFVFPMAFGFLVRFSREIAQAQGIDMMDVTTVDAFVGIALKMLLAFGLIFELPVVVSFLAMAGIVDHKQLWKFGRWFVVISVAVGALLTPPDVISQVMMAVPMSILYLISIGLAYILHPARRKKREEKKVAKDKVDGDGKKSKATGPDSAAESSSSEPDDEAG